MTVEIRSITCNACGADRFEPLSQAGEWVIGHCATCGLVYVNPSPFFSPSDEFSDMSRAFEYTEYMHAPITESILAFERRQLEANARMMAVLGAVPHQGSHPRRFLDLGCGSGASVRAAADLGWEAIGIDLDPQLVREGRDQLHVDIRCVPILDADLPTGSFDFIKLRDVIEHLPNPLEILARIRDLLAPGGVVLLVTPNEGSLATRVRVTLRRRRMVVATAPPPHHLHSFGPGSIQRTMRRAGLVPVRTLTTTPFDWTYVTSNNVARASRLPVVRPLWVLGAAAGMGAVLVSWGRPEASGQG